MGGYGQRTHVRLIPFYKIFVAPNKRFFLVVQLSKDTYFGVFKACVSTCMAAICLFSMCLLHLMASDVVIGTVNYSV